MYFCILDYNRPFKSSNEIHCHHYRPQRSCGKVIFSQVSVSHSVDRGCVYPSMHWGRHPPRRHLPRQTPRSCKHPPGQTPPSSRRLLQRTVRILLECILVPLFCLFIYTFFHIGGFRILRKRRRPPGKTQQTVFAKNPTPLLKLHEIETILAVGRGCHYNCQWFLGLK